MSAPIGLRVSPLWTCSTGFSFYAQNAVKGAAQFRNRSNRFGPVLVRIPHPFKDDDENKKPRLAK